ncbi:MAG: hypothetical protein RIR00_1547 [Pseudomonadota bacterium]
MNSPRPYRAAVIGCGLIGAGWQFSSSAGIYAHTAAYAACPDTRLVGVCDLDPDKARAAGAAWQVPAYTDPARLYAECAPEIVSICTPDASHGDQLRQALAQPGLRAILAEKPLALDLAEARALVASARQQGVTLAVNYSRRYAPGHQALAARLRAGLIGDLCRFHGYYTKGTRHNGSHWFDWLRLFAGEVAWVEGSNGLGESGPDPTLDARLGLANGAIGQLHALDARRYSLFELELVGSHGRLSLTESGHRYRLELAGPSPRYAGYQTLLESENADAGLHDTLLHAVNDLAAALHQPRPPACSGQDGLAALAIADAILRSAETGERVMLTG